jgi:hypothetical protein
MAARKKTKSSRPTKAKPVSRVVTSRSTSSNTRPIPLNVQTLITVFFLVFFYPLGVVLMFLWTRWPFWIKMVIAIPLTLFFIMIALPILAVLFLLHKITDYDEARNLISTQPAPTPIVRTASPSATIMLSPTPGATMKYSR